MANVNPITVFKEKTKYHSFAISFAINRDTIDYCRSLKTKFGWKRFTYYEDKWRFSDPEIILEMKKEVQVILDPDTQRLVQTAELRNQEKVMIEERAIELKQATDTTFVPDGVKADMYPYQRIGVEFFVNNQGRAILADSQGLGKTLQSLAYVAHSKFKRTLIVCPASVKYSWADETKKWTKLKPTVVDSKEGADKLLNDNSQVFIINYDLLEKFLSVITKQRWDCIILDEAHYIKSPRAKRTRAVRAISAYCPAIIMLSGTPFLNRPAELYTLLNIIDPKGWPNYFDFTARYCGGKRTQWGWEAKGATNMLELQQKIAKYFLRRTKDNVLKELPKKIFIEMPVKLDKDTWNRYVIAQNSYRDYLRNIKKRSVEELRTMNHGAERMMQLNELRTLTTAGKMKAVEELIENILNTGEKVVVFSCYNEPLETLHAKFKGSVMITGKINAEARSESVKQFQTNPDCRVFFGGIKSAGSGITLTAGTNVVFIDFSWTPGDHSQAQDRIHRIGSTAASVNIYTMYAKSTIDEMMKEILREKQALFDVIIEGKGDAGDSNLLIDELEKRLMQAEELSKETRED